MKREGRLWLEPPFLFPVRHCARRQRRKVSRVGVIERGEGCSVCAMLLSDPHGFVSADNDRGRARNNVERQKPAARMSDRQMQDRQMPDRKVENRKQNAFQGARDNGNRERAASQRGKASVQRQGGNRAGGRKR